MLRETLRRLGPEFGFLKEESDQVEQDVINKLDHSVKLDEVDTVTFGLETDDGKIVKVYVKADQAEDFEKALSEKLGEIDDIEEVLNMLSKDFEIVDVEWPSEDTGETDEEEDDGSDVLDNKVYDNAKENAETEAKLKPNMESISFGERATLEFLDESNSANSIESRFTTATQLLVYHAILELGVPEIALARSPYRAAIIKGIKAKAMELARSASIKNSLKTFINRSIDFEDRAEKNKEAAGGKELNDSIKPSNEKVLTEGVTQVFWETFVKFVNYLATDQELAKKFLESPQLKQLMSRSSASIASNVSAQMQTKMKELAAAIDAEPKTESLNESASPDEIYEFMQNMLSLADADGKTADAALKSSAWNAFFNSFKTKLSQKFGSSSRSKLSSLEKLMPTSTAATAAPVGESLKNACLACDYKYGSEKFEAGHPVEVIGEDGDYYIVKAFPIMATGHMKFKKGDIKLDGKINVPVGGNGGRMPGGLNESEVPEWSFDMEDDLTIIQCQNLKVKLNGEEIEKLVKGVSNKDAVIVRDEEDPTHKVAFSPRGTSVMVKKVGTSEGVMMKQKDVDSMLDFIAKGKDDEQPEDETADDQASIDAEVDTDVKKESLGEAMKQYLDKDRDRWVVWG